MKHTEALRGGKSVFCATLQDMVVIIADLLNQSIPSVAFLHSNNIPDENETEHDAKFDYLPPILT